jgi:hypothetical protein
MRSVPRTPPRCIRSAPLNLLIAPADTLFSPGLFASSGLDLAHVKGHSKDVLTERADTLANLGKGASPFSRQLVRTTWSILTLINALKTAKGTHINRYLVPMLVSLRAGNCWAAGRPARNWAVSGGQRQLDLPLSDVYTLVFANLRQEGGQKGRFWNQILESDSDRGKGRLPFR